MKQQKKEKKKKFKEFQRIASLNTAFSLFFNLLPFWAGILLTLSMGKAIDWSRFYSSGEFYLYSTSLISSAYLIYHNNKLKATDLSSIFSILSLMLIVAISILYASLTANNGTHDLFFIKAASITAIVFAIPIFFYSQIIHNRKSPNVTEQRRDEQQTIMEGLS